MMMCVYADGCGKIPKIALSEKHKFQNEFFNTMLLIIRIASGLVD